MPVKTNDGTVSLVSEKGKRIITLKDLLELHDIDEQLWEIVRQTANVWEQAQNKKDGSTELIQLHQVKADLKPRGPLVEYKEAIKKLFQNDIPVLKGPVYKDGPLLANINLSDIHYGRINEKKPQAYLQSIKDRTLQLFDRMLKDKPDKLLFVQLGDFFDAELNGRTSSGKHEQHLSMPPKEMFRNGLQFHIDLIKTLASELPTEVIFVPANHDRDVLFQMGEAVSIYFSNTNNVKIDNDDKPRKYVSWGDTNIGTCHGHEVRVKDLFKLFADEKGFKKYNYQFLGHYHEAELKQYGPLIVEILGSPSVQSDRERNKFSSKGAKLIANEFDKKKGLVKRYYS